ncbi:MAG: hypothetical protein AAF581_08980 [Planctomycetota bacterium]
MIFESLITLAGVGAFSDNAGYNTTVLHPLGAAMMLTAGVAIVVLPRARVFLPLFLLLSLTPEIQRITVASLDFRFLRLMLCFAWFRLLVRGELRSLKYCAIDYMIVGWSISRSIATTVNYDGTSGLIYSLGQSFDALGTYFLFRMVIKDREDIVRVLRDAMIVSLVVALFFLQEKQTGINIFGQTFGGVRGTTVIRDGRLRIQGAYAHPIIAGCLWAVMFPQFCAIFLRARESKALPAIGILCTLIIIYCCASSTPVMALMFGFVGAAMFQLRSLMRVVRWGIPIGLLFLHMVMSAPVWHLISRIDVVGGSTGWHRYILIEMFVQHFNEWWLHGVRSTAHWNGIIDITNQYVLEGVFGGLMTLILFVFMIGFAFQSIGRAMRATPNDRWQQLFCWSLGVGMFMHVMNFLAVSYFGQVMLIWYLQLALIASIAQVPTNARQPVGPQPAQPQQPRTSRRPVVRGAPEIYA